MEYELDTSHETYIKISVSGVVDKVNLIAAISELVMHPDYEKKYSLWDFSRGKMGLSIGDLKEVVGILRLYKIKSKNFANKSAILVPGMLNKAIADVFTTMSKFLPFEYKVFTEFDKAEAFLCG